MEAFLEKYRTALMGSAGDALWGKGMYINKRHACPGSDKKKWTKKERNKKKK